MAGFDPNDPKLQKFLKSLVRSFINAGIFRAVSRMNTPLLVVLLALAIGATVYFGWYE
jgi:hypothetical protein